MKFVGRIAVGSSCTANSLPMLKGLMNLFWRDSADPWWRQR